MLRETIAPLLRDLEATRRALPEIREEAHEDYGENAVCAWIQDNGRRGQGIRVWLFCSPAERLRDLAEELQSWAGDVQVDPGRRPWPDCPDHPGSHNLSVATRDEVAVWRCPGSGRVIAAIGSLEAHRSALSRLPRHAVSKDRLTGFLAGVGEAPSQVSPPGHFRVAGEEALGPYRDGNHKGREAYEKHGRN